MSSNRIRAEWGIAATCVVAAIAFGGAAVSYGLTADTGVGAGLMPLVAAVFVGGAGLLWALRLAAERVRGAPPAHLPDLPTATGSIGTDAPFEALLEGEESDEMDDESLPDKAAWLRIGTIVGSVALGAALLPLLGYSVVMVLMLTTVLIFVGGRRWWISLLVALVVTGLSRLVFEVWLNTALPHASIAPLSWIGL
ncbi:hypothetical protein C5E07_09865 [Pseudoclavibacter sp. RFBJ3]|uniref:tripartite tricarboxylate transporter TctB family protein n=1 Tax=unclassified Pseudoclavibacter TaxID=2615177 RepID=UPI000CE71E4D|nr:MULTISPECIES: tripartite tricarboxylate transporter TctB family protein [unclassified Pseudoclavibacter]PPF83789.1 hypothetical protein C5C12_08945 [Pseudoclavibacter sp. RFBJ5]PPF92069.1 hypothetical protein C5E07_09865 [Pseudoclavibacter sp. RFBJ3]PPF96932.1 hypothetical protein C5C19_13175 [Pseudoclavibacter sp. RFBH5]PPG23619.1 hypothetical protein C5E13_08560 [Pseudoclavibacter sp. RFBI4]